MLERVQKIISNAGYCSRRKAEELIEDGQVKVNNVKITIGDKADPKKDKISIKGRPLQFEKKHYLAFYKPKNVVTTNYDPRGRPTVQKFMQGLRERVYPVGRLDIDAEGLLLMTNDGDFANKVMHPRYEHTKTYRAELKTRVRKNDLEKFRGKIILTDGPVEIEHAKLINQFEIELTIHEGRHKIVKRIIKELGFYVKRLKRVKVGTVNLGTLKPGAYRNLTPKEIKSFV